MAMKVDVVLDSEGKQQLLIYDAKESELLLGLHVERQGNNGAVTIGGITNWGFLENKSKTPRERMYYRQTQILLRHIVLARLRARGYSSVLVRASGKEKDLFRSLGFKQPSGSNAGSLEKTLIAKPPFSGARLAIEKIKQAALPTAEEIDLLYTGFTSDGTKRIDSAHVMTLGYVSRDHVVRVFLADFIDREAKGKKIDILSIGPGHGDFEALLNSRGHRVLAVDASRENVLYTSQKGVETRLADAHALPDLGRKFDLVLMSESVGHLRIMEAFRQAKEQLKPGGKLIVTTYFGSSMEESRLNLEKIRYFDYEPQDIHSAITLSGLWNRSAHRMVVEPRNPKRGIEEDRGLLIYTAVKPSGFKMFFRRAHGARLAHGERGFVNFGLYPNRSLFFGEPGDLENSFIMRLRSIDDEAETAEISIHRASTHEELTRATLTLYTQNDFEYGEHEIWITPELFYDGLLLAINKPRGKIFVDTWAHVKYRVRKGNVLLEGARLAKNVSRHQSPMFKVRPNDVLAISVKLDDKAVRRLLKAEWQDAQAIHMTVRSYENPMDILSWITPGLGKKEILTVNGAQFTISVTSISGDYSRITVEKPYGTFVRRHDRSAARLAKNPVESSQPSAARLADSNHFVGEHSLRTTRADVATSLTRDKKLYLEAIKARIAEHENFPIEAQDGIVNFAREGNVIYFLGENGERLRDGAGRLLQFAPSDEDLRAVSGNVEIDRSLSIAPLEKQEITVSELVSDADRAADGVVAAAEPFAAELSQIAQTFVFDLDTLPADAAQRPAYIQHLLRVLAAIRAKSVAQNVYFRFKSTQNNLEEIYGNPLAAGLGESLVREPVRGVREVHLTLPGHFAADQANIPVEAFEAGRELHLMAFVLFSIVTGKWSAIEGNKGKAVPEAFVDVYRTFLGEKAKDASTQEIAGALHAFLNGQTGPNILSLAMKFALPKLRPVGWSRMLQAFKNIERMVGQAA